jgi:hypothetical protein
MTAWRGAVPEEMCNGLDDDCDGAADEDAVDGALLFLDADADLYGDTASGERFCAASDGWIATAGDCDDVDSGVHPGVSDVCNGLDDDCDGSVDEDAAIAYRDSDRDTFGGATLGPLCLLHAGQVRVGGDCNDSRGGVNPTAIEVCDGIDNDCNLTVDVGGTCYLDADGDGFGVSFPTAGGCPCPAGYASRAGDRFPHLTGRH